MQKECEELAKENNLEIKIIEGEELRKEKLNLMWDVGKASIFKPRLVNLTYRGNPDSKEVIAYVGKGLCFDSGGLNIKTGNHMSGMHLDKSGACCVMAAIRSIARLKLKVNVTASMGFVENSVAGNAYRPLDILTSRKGLTVEIGNTDAEGRLTLADVMHWTQEVFKPKTLIELSTLTGAVVVALGSTAGLWSNNDTLTKQLERAAVYGGDPLWHMPITTEA
jgi:leucyl aminopeptidase